MLRGETKPNRGFTLIELLVVISIVGLISSIAIANLNESRKKARVAALIASLKNITTGVSVCHSSGGFLSPYKAVFPPNCGGVNRLIAEDS